MELFAPIFTQMIFLFSFIIIGFILSKWKFIPENSATILSKLENIVFVPALVMGTFMNKCTIETLKSVGMLLLLGFALVLVLIPISLLFAKLCFKEKYLQKIATYGLAFSNFGFMGNAIVLGVFGADVFFEYTIFTLPLWFMIYLWGAPVLLISGSNENGEKVKFSQRIKSFLNPMFIAMFIGMIFGLTGFTSYIPQGFVSVIDSAGACMSPLAMLLTGMTIGKLNLLKLLSKWRLYLLSFVKLIVYPLLFIVVFAFVPTGNVLTETVLICAMCVMAMPTGLNTIVIPAAYGKDTSDAAGMALITHILSVGTIPLMFMLLQNVVL